MKSDYSRSAPAGAVYGLGLIGAAIYLFHRQQAFGWECWGF